MTQAVEQKEKRLDNPYDFFDGFDEEEIEEGLNDRTKPLFDELREYEHVAYDADSPDHFAQQLLYLRYAYIQEGSLYYHIWQNCLWKYAGASSFTAYCKREFGTRWYQIKGKVQASRIACYLLSEGFNELPKTAYQCKILQLLLNEAVDWRDGFDRIRDVWEKVLKKHKIQDITGKIIKNEIALQYPEFIPERKKIDVFLNVDTADELRNTAHSEGVSQNDLLLDMLHERNNQETEDLDVTPKEVQDIIKENNLMYRLREVCREISVKVTDVLEFLTQENNLKKLLKKGLKTAIISLTIEKMVTRTNLPLEKIEDAIALRDFTLINSFDPDGFIWDFNYEYDLFFTDSS